MAGALGIRNPMRLPIAALAAVAIAAGCGSQKPWTAGRTVFIGGDGKCASAVSPDKAERLFICHESDGTSTCSYFRYWQAGAETSFDGDCKNARSAVVNAGLLPGTQVASPRQAAALSDTRSHPGRTSRSLQAHSRLENIARRAPPWR